VSTAYEGSKERIGGGYKRKRQKPQQWGHTQNVESYRKAVFSVSKDAWSEKKTVPLCNSKDGKTEKTKNCLR